MSQETVWEFVQTIRNSPSLRDRCSELGRAPSDLATFVALGREHHLEFTEADAAAYFGQAVPAGEDAELTDRELSGVAGGVGALALPISKMLGLRATSPPTRFALPFDGRIRR